MKWVKPEAPAEPAAATERLEARVSPELKRLFKRAADLQGVTVSDFLIGSVRQAALQVLEQHEVIRLSGRDASRFARALIGPPSPNARLRAAARRYRKFKNDQK
ncbi:MAG TPA: DUF1778 domain-containing protein [Verrucomicrobiae bacterium]|jgi:uncharacterized protein (DUF1778 family)